MSINLASTSNGRINYGDVAAIAGATELTISLIIKPSQALSDVRYIVSQWGDTGAEQAFLFASDASGNVYFGVADSGANFYGRSGAAGLSNGSEARILLTFLGGSPPTLHIWVNNSDLSLSSWIASNNVTALNNAASGVVVGHEIDTATDGLDADYSEFAIWTRVLTGGEIAQLQSSNQPASCISDATGRVIYGPLTNTTDLVDQWSSIVASLTDGSNATQPTMASCGGGGGGNPYYAYAQQ